LLRLISSQKIHIDLVLKRIKLLEELQRLYKECRLTIRWFTSWINWAF